MSIYLREYKTPSGKVYKNLVKLPKGKKFWNKEKSCEGLSNNYMSYQSNKKGAVTRVICRDKDGSVTTHTLMTKPVKDFKR